MQKCSIYVVSHKPFKRPNKSYLKPIQVGFAESIADSLRDNTGNNIADKNKNYCELTALYWIWKNDIMSDIKGICHYRRYFTIKKYSKNSDFFLDNEKIAEYLKEFDIIVPKPLNFKMDIWHNYFVVGKGFEKDLMETQRIISVLFPQYLPDFQRVMKRKWGYYFNMFITESDKYNEYCQWLFQILQALEENIDIRKYSNEEARVFGYISELLLNVWIEHNQLRCKEIPVVNTDMKILNIVKFDTKHMLRSFLYGKNKL